MKKKKNNRKVLKLLFVFIIATAIIFGISYYFKENKIEEFIKGLETEIVSVDKYYIYGSHFNIEGKMSNVSNIKDAKIVILYTNGEEQEEECIWKVENKDLIISTSQYINKGIELEKIDSDAYGMFLKIEYPNEELKYYTFQNNTSYDNLEYYTITKNEENKKIEISFNKTKNNNIPFIELTSKIIKIPETVYDISIDPGHGGSDPGAVYGKYQEAEIAMKYGLKLKEKLEALGLKIILTRDGTEDKSKDSKFSVYSVYDHDGRVNLVGRAKVKYNLSIHLNSLDVNTIRGTEIYAPSNADLTMAKSFADNIVKQANTTYSSRTTDKVLDGVYVRTFTEEQIEESVKDARKRGFKPYSITTSTPYLYMIREVGGIVTGAYVDGRNKIYGKNEYYNSNIGVESYLIELGYINNKDDLNNMLNNESKYIEAIANTVKEFTLQ